MSLPGFRKPSCQLDRTRGGHKDSEDGGDGVVLVTVGARKSQETYITNQDPVFIRANTFL